MLLRKIFIFIMIILFSSCEDPMKLLYPDGTEVLINYTNVTNEGKGEFEGSVTTIVNNSTWTIKANIYRANNDKSYIRTVHMNSRAVITINYAPIYVEINDTWGLKANLSTKNYIYILNN